MQEQGCGGNLYTDQGNSDLQVLISLLTCSELYSADFFFKTSMAIKVILLYNYYSNNATLVFTIQKF